MKDRLRADLRDAIKARNTNAVAALRSVLAAIENAEAVDVDARTLGVQDSTHIAGAASGLGAGEGARRMLSEHDVLAIIRDEQRQYVDAASRASAAGRADLARRHTDQAGVLSSYLTDAR